MSGPLPSYGSRARGITQIEVSQAADTLLRDGERPTVEKIRATIGSGSPNTVGPLLDAWWKRLSGRLDAGPAAFHRLPEAVAHVAEALWMQALEEGRRRALLEQRMTDQALAHDKERLEIRSHVLTLREGELDSRLRDRERLIVTLERQLRELTVLLRKAEASRDAHRRRSVALEAELLARQSTARSQRSKQALRSTGPERRPRPANTRPVPTERKSTQEKKSVNRKRRR